MINITNIIFFFSAFNPPVFGRNSQLQPARCFCKRGALLHSKYIVNEWFKKLDNT